MKTFVISEAGVNHMGSLDKAKELAYASLESGASAVKYQIYQTHKRVSKDNSAYDILKKCELSYDDFVKLKEYCDTIGIEFFATPFDRESLEFMVKDLGVRRVKISSFDLTNATFLDNINALCKLYDLNVIISTGMRSSYYDIENAWLIHLIKAKTLSILHCVSSYPMNDKDANLSCIRELKDKMCPGKNDYLKIGYSDHSTGIDIPVYAVLVGSEVLEKHFTLDKTDGSVDNSVSADPGEFRKMVNKIKYIEEVMGDGSFGLQECEQEALKFKR